MRTLAAFLLLCSCAFGQVKVEVRQLLTGVSGLETIEGKTFVSADSKPVVESVGFVDLGKIPAKPQVLRVRVTDAARKPVPTERLTDSQYVIRGEGRVWIDARVTDLPSQFLLDEEVELELPPKVKPLPNPIPTPGPQPIPADDIDRIVSNALLELRSGYSQAFKAAGDAVKRGDLKVDAKLQAFLYPITKKVKEDALYGVDVLIQEKLPRDGVNLKPEAAGFLDSIGQAFGRGLK